MLSLDSRDDAQRWGHFVPRSGVARRRAAGAISAQRIAAIAVVLAVLIPATIQAKSKNLLADAFHNGKKSGAGANGLGAGTGGIDPFVTLRGDLVRDSPINLLTVQVQREDNGPSDVQPFYARANVLEDYTGTGWVAAGHGLLQPLLSTRFLSTPGTPTAPRTASFDAEITIKNLKSDPPVFVQPVQLTGDINTPTEWSSQDQLLVGGSTHSNQQYNISFNQPDPTAADLNAANTVDPSLAAVAATAGTIAPMVHTLVDRLTANASTQYAKALAIDQYFTNPANGFGYNLHVPPGKTGDPLVDFLTNKVGFCQQYAAAMGVMLRLAGVPSRVVLGYAHAEPDNDRFFTITTNDAHAWVEAYFDGIGWIPFDPTPLAGISGGTKSDLPWALHAKASNNTSSSASQPPVSKPDNGLTNSGGPKTNANRVHTTRASARRSPSSVVWSCSCSPWRRCRGCSAPPGDGEDSRLGRGGDADAVWAELSDTATDLGYVWSPARTPRQVVDWLGRDAGTAQPQLTALAAAVEVARYAPPGSAAVDGDALARTSIDFRRS